MHVVRDSQPLILLFLFSYFGLKNFLYGQAPFCTDVSVFAIFIVFSRPFFSKPDIFGLPSFFFFVEPNQILSRINNLTIQTRTTVLSHQVLVPKRGKKKDRNSLYPVNHLNQRKSPSTTLVSKEIETDFFRRRFSRSREKFPKLRTLV